MCYVHCTILRSITEEESTIIYSIDCIEEIVFLAEEFLRVIFCGNSPSTTTVCIKTTSIVTRIFRAYEASLIWRFTSYTVDSAYWGSRLLDSHFLI